MTAAELLKAADAAMYAAKVQRAATVIAHPARGRNRPGPTRTLIFPRWPNLVETHGDNDACRA